MVAGVRDASSSLVPRVITPAQSPRRSLVVKTHSLEATRSPADPPWFALPVLVIPRTAGTVLVTALAHPNAAWQKHRTGRGCYVSIERKKCRLFRRNVDSVDIPESAPSDCLSRGSASAWLAVQGRGMQMLRPPLARSSRRCPCRDWRSQQLQPPLRPPSAGHRHAES